MSADKIGEHVITAPKEIHDPFVVAIVGRDGLPDQLTFHHPIGSTRLPRGSWVCTPTKEMYTLLARARDPDENQIAQAEKLVLNDLWVEHGLLKRSETGDLLYARLNISRKASIDAAEKAYKDRIVELREQHQKDNAEKIKKPIFRSSLTPGSFLSDEVRAEEIRLHKWTKDNESLLRARVPRKYETCSGTLGETRQVVVPYLKEGMDANAARAVVLQTIYRAAIGMSPMVTTPKSVEPPMASQPKASEVKPAPPKTPPPAVNQPQVEKETPSMRRRFFELFSSKKAEDELTLDDLSMLVLNITEGGSSPISYSDLGVLLGPKLAPEYITYAGPAIPTHLYKDTVVGKASLVGWLSNRRDRLKQKEAQA